MNIYEEQAPHTTSRLEYANKSDKEIDQLFYLPPFYRALIISVRELASKTWELAEDVFINNDDKRTEWLFASRALAFHGASIPKVRHLLKSVPPDMQLDTLKKKRMELITRLAGTEAGKHWMDCIRQPEGWVYAARFMCSPQSSLSAGDFDEFLLSLDQIAIIHDLIMGRGKKYGLDFRVQKNDNVEAVKQYCRKPEQASKILRLLHMYIDKAKKAKGASEPVRAAMDAGALIKRLPWELYEKEFGKDINNETSYNDYTNPDKKHQFDDALYPLMVKDFKEL